MLCVFQCHSIRSLSLQDINCFFSFLLKTWKVKYTYEISVGWKSFQNVQWCLVEESPLGKGEGTDGQAKSEQLNLGYRAGTDALLCAVPTPCPKIVL